MAKESLAHQYIEETTHAFEHLLATYEIGNLHSLRQHLSDSLYNHTHF